MSHIVRPTGQGNAGKTTLMSIMCNHIFTMHGTIRIAEESPAENASLITVVVSYFVNQHATVICQTGFSATAMVAIG